MGFHRTKPITRNLWRNDLLSSTSISWLLVTEKRKEKRNVDVDVTHWVLSG